MAKGHRANCLHCGRHKSEVGPISWGGYCGACGPALAHAWNDGLREGRGPVELHFARQNELYWRKRRIAAERATA